MPESGSEDVRPDHGSGHSSLPDEFPDWSSDEEEREPRDDTRDNIRSERYGSVDLSMDVNQERANLKAVFTPVNKHNMARRGAQSSEDRAQKTYLHHPPLSSSKRRLLQNTSPLVAELSRASVSESRSAISSDMDDLEDIPARLPPKYQD
jgi:hypothetical protein